MSDTKKLRIAVVDDNRDFTDSTATLLELWGYDVAVAYDGQEAIELCSTFHPDLMLVDIMMPRMDGNELAKTIRKQEGCKNTILVAVTGYGDESHRQLSFQAGFDFYLLKPLKLEQFEELLRIELFKSQQACQGTDVKTDEPCST
jgi:CheY-like chemotaxis protein